MTVFSHSPKINSTDKKRPA